MSEEAQSVPPAVTQADIEAYIAAEVAKAVAAATTSAPVNELTPTEKLRATAADVVAAGGRDLQYVAAAIAEIVAYVTEGK